MLNGSHPRPNRQCRWQTIRQARPVFSFFMIVCLSANVANRGAAEPLQLSGIYPHLAMFNEESECGTGAVVPWANRLWVITYAPHLPRGSSDKLYEITPDRRQIIRPESIGGTPANRMIHRESNQLFIGPYAIDGERRVRAIPYHRMFGRHTGNARHLTDPVHRIYYGTMEEGIYEVDVRSLEVTELWADEALKDGRHADLPGYHGKGLYSGQGRLIYANNGEHGPAAQRQPNVPSGCLAEWDGNKDSWTVVRRNQFTEVTGPGGIYGNENPDQDPVWTIGWDHRSLILMILHQGEWKAYRLPKASHAYDGAHGWNTEWPRIRDVGESDLLMTMHGMFWWFPRTFTPASSSGIQAVSTYLKVIGDFCRWQDQFVFGCDDTARNEFLNKRQAKGTIAAPQSQSNLWFVDPDGLSELGPVLGRGAIWLDEDISAGTWSDPFLFSGFDERGLHLAHRGVRPVTIRLQTDRRGDGVWETTQEILLDPNAYLWVSLQGKGTWIRLGSDSDLSGATAWFHYANHDPRSAQADPKFEGLARVEDRQVTGGLLRARAENKRTLQFAALRATPQGPEELGYYEMGAELKLIRVDDPQAHAFLKSNAALPVGVLQTDAASVIFVNEDGTRYRLPRGDAAFDDDGPLGPSRVDREVSTERDLFNAHGSFYELPAENAGGFAKVRPVATHNRRVIDYCSYRGLFIVSGVAEDAAENPHIIRSDDGLTALWAGVIDDIWKLGKPVGVGGPWKNTAVEVDQLSDPYLMTGYDRKELALSHDQEETVTMTLEIDVSGTGSWQIYRSFEVKPGSVMKHRFPTGFQAYWVRVRGDRSCRATAQLDYR